MVHPAEELEDSWQPCRTTLAYLPNWAGLEERQEERAEEEEESWQPCRTTLAYLPNWVVLEELEERQEEREEEEDYWLLCNQIQHFWLN